MAKSQPAKTVASTGLGNGHPKGCPFPCLQGFEKTIITPWPKKSSKHKRILLATQSQ